MGYAPSDEAPEAIDNARRSGVVKQPLAGISYTVIIAKLIIWRADIATGRGIPTMRKRPRKDGAPASAML